MTLNSYCQTNCVIYSCPTMHKVEDKKTPKNAVHIVESVFKSGQILLTVSQVLLDHLCLHIYFSYKFHTCLSFWQSWLRNTAHHLGHPPFIWLLGVETPHTKNWKTLKKNLFFAHYLCSHE